jgi:predicted homoserine dehydrogenase-like protein
MAQQRAAAGQPVRVGLIGAGKFGSMFLAQVPRMAGVEVPVVADLDPERARAACGTVGWDATQIAKTEFVASGAEACAHPGIEVVVEATGVPTAGIAHVRAAIGAKKHIVMVNVEADVLAGPLLAAEARAAGTRWRMAINRRWSASWSTGHEPAVSSSPPPARGLSTCHPTTR